MASVDANAMDVVTAVDSVGDNAATAAAPKRKESVKPTKPKEKKAVRPAMRRIALFFIILRGVAGSPPRWPRVVPYGPLALTRDWNTPCAQAQGQKEKPDGFTVDDEDEEEAKQPKVKHVPSGFDQHGGQHFDDPSYLQARWTNLSDAVKLPREALLQGYASVALTAGIAPVPKQMGQSGPKGPFQFYPKEATDVDLLIAQCKVLHVQYAAEGEQPIDVELTLERIEIFEGGGDATAQGLSPEVVAAQSVHVIAFLEPGAESRLINVALAKRAWQEANFTVFRAGRGHVKLDGERTEIETEEMHFNVRPLSGSMGDAEWPSRLKIHVKYTNHKVKKERDFFVRFVICEHEEMPEADFCLRKCHKKRPCPCDRKHERPEGGPSQPYKRQRTQLLKGNALGTRADGPTSDPPRAPLAHSRCVRVCVCVRVRTADKLCAGFRKASPDKAMSPCKFLGLGTCLAFKRGSTCGFNHMMDLAVARQIPCAREAKGQKCTAMCLYAHTKDQKERDARFTAMDEKEAEAALAAAATAIGSESCAAAILERLRKREQCAQFTGIVPVFEELLIILAVVW